MTAKAAAAAPARPIEVFRIGLARAGTLAEHAVGSTLAQGRWHGLRPAGQAPRRAVYAAATRALAQLEKRVHANGVQPVGLALFRLTLPPGLTPADIRAQGLPADWRHDEDATRALGNRWLDEGRDLALLVPSYVEPAEDNLLINAAHPRVAEIVFTCERDPFEFDPRLR